MSLDEFIKTWDGKFLEVAGGGEAINQCVDLANGYIRDCLGLPIIEWTNAIDFPSKAGSNYDYIVNDPTDPNQLPLKGDLIVWKPSPGHIAIWLDKIDDNHFHSFDQNFPLNSVCHIQEHTWTNVIGWLHPKVSNLMEIDKDTFTQLVSKSTQYDAFVAGGYSSVDDVKKTIDSLNQDINGYQNTIKQLDIDKANLKQLFDDSQNAYEQTREMLAKANDEILQLKNQQPLQGSTCLFTYKEIVIGKWHTGLYFISNPV